MLYSFVVQYFSPFLGDFYLMIVVIEFVAFPDICAALSGWFRAQVAEARKGREISGSERSDG
jgi:hypothetical protein